MRRSLAISKTSARGRGLTRLVALMLLAACGGARVAAPEARWVRADSQHFTLYTDFPARHAEQRVVQLERLLSAYRENGWEVRGELPLRLNVVIFQNANDFRTYGGSELGGYYKSDVQFEPWIVLPDPSQDGSLDILRHELTHHIAYLGLHAQPPWFSEGIAVYFQTATFDESGLFTIGGVPRDLWNVVRRRGPMHVKVLLDPNVNQRDPWFYATSWLLVHYLMSVHQDGFGEYQRRIGFGLSDADAWAAAFPNLPRDKLDAELRDYLAAQQFAKFSLPVTASRATARSSALSVADRHALQALLYRFCRACGSDADARAKQHIELALAADRTQPQAATLQLFTSRMTPAARTTAARALTAARPDAWLGWLALGLTLADEHALGTVDRAADPVARLDALAPRHPYGRMLSALQREQRGDREGALADAERVRKMAPRNLYLLWRSAELHARLSACDGLQRVMRTIHAIGHDALDASTQAQLGALARTCTPR